MEVAGLENQADCQWTLRATGSGKGSVVGKGYSHHNSIANTHVSQETLGFYRLVELGLVINTERGGGGTERLTA